MASNSVTELGFLAPVEDLLPLVESRMRSQTSHHHPDLVLALNQLLSSGGKRIRPAVALLTGRMLGADNDRLVSLSAAIELLHTATLVHDDFIDDAMLRRGTETLNAQWSPAATVLTGDFIFAGAAKLAAETNSVRLMGLFAETLAVIVNGELTQLFDEGGLISREIYLDRIYEKTASLFEHSATAAAILSPVDEDTIENMGRFGFSLGMAFQITDDVLDFTGQQVTVGKPVGSDLRQRLITLPVILYSESNPRDRGVVSLSNGLYLENKEIDHLIGKIQASGAVDQALSMANEYIEQGVGILEPYPESEEKVALSAVAQSIVNRSY